MYKSRNGKVYIFTMATSFFLSTCGFFMLTGRDTYTRAVFQHITTYHFHDLSLSPLVNVTNCHHHDLSPLRLITVTTCHRHGLSPSRFVTVTTCHRYDFLLPRLVTVTIYHCHNLRPSQLSLSRLVTVTTCHLTRGMFRVS